MDTRGAGAPSRGQGRQTFFVDVERERLKASHPLGKVKPTLPGNAKQWQHLRKATPKAPSVKASSTSSPGFRSSQSQYAGKDDPLSLKDPPSGVDSGLQLNLDADYLEADVNRDSLLADVQALLAQERMLTEQAEWWQERVRREREAKDSLQASQQTQEATLSQEEAEIRRAIAACSAERTREERRRQGLQNEAAVLREEASDAQRQAMELKVKLEEIADISSPQEAARIHSIINHALFAAQAPKGNRRSVQKGLAASDQGSSMPNSARSREQIRSGPNSARSGPLEIAKSMSAKKGASPKAKTSPRTAPPPKAGGVGLAPFEEDFNDNMDFFSGSGGGGAPRASALGPSTGGGLGGLGDLGLDQDDDDEFGNMFG